MASQKLDLHEETAIAIIRVLLEHGADVPVQVLLTSIMKRNDEVIDLLLGGVETINPEKLLDVGFAACQYGVLQVVRRLCELHFFGVKDRVKRKALSGWTLGDSPLHLAVASRNVELVIFLLNEGADVHALNANDLTPWDLTTEEFKLSINQKRC